MGTSDRFDDRLFRRIDEIVAAAVENGDAPGVVAAVACGDVVHVATAGVMSVGGHPMARDTLFRISSNTKRLTAAVVLSLIDDRMLHLDDAVDALLPEFANRRVLRRPDGPLDETVAAERSITVRDLLTFTRGFGRQGAMFMAAEPWPIVTAAEERQLASFGPPQPANTPDPDTWMARLGELPLLCQPGERWLYQSGSQVTQRRDSAAAPELDARVANATVPTPVIPSSQSVRSPARLPTTVTTARSAHAAQPPGKRTW